MNVKKAIALATIVSISTVTSEGIVFNRRTLATLSDPSKEAAEAGNNLISQATPSPLSLDMAIADAMSTIKNAASGDGCLELKPLLGEFNLLGEMVPFPVSPPNISETILFSELILSNPICQVNVSLHEGKPGLLGEPGREIQDNGQATLGDVDNTTLKISGTTSFLGLENMQVEFDLFAAYEQGKGLPRPQLTVKVSPPDDTTKYLPLGFLNVDTPVGTVIDFERVQVKNPTVVIASADTLYDMKLDSGIAPGFNIFGNIELNKTENSVLKFLGTVLHSEEQAFHIAVTSVSPEGTFVPKLTLETSFKEDITPFSGVPFKLTRSDFSFSRSAGEEPEVSLGTDLVIDIQDSLTENSGKHSLVFTGALGFKPESITGALTLNGTGRSATGELSGTNQNTGDLNISAAEWTNVFGFPGLTVRQAALQVGMTYEPPGIDTFGIHGNLKIGDVDGTISFLTDTNNPGNYVAAASAKHVTLAALMSAMTPATFAAYESLAPDIKESVNGIVNASLNDVHISLVPTPTSIGGVHFREPGATVFGTMNLWGWEGDAYLNVDYVDGLTVRAELEKIDLLNGVFRLERDANFSGPATRQKLIRENEVYKFVDVPQGEGPVLDVRLGPTADSKAQLSAAVTLLGITESVGMNIDKSGLNFVLTSDIGNGNSATFTSTFADGRFAAATEFKVHLGQLEIPGIEVDGVKLADSFSLPTDVNADLKGELSIDGQNFILKLDASEITYQGYTLTTPELQLQEASHVDDIYTAVKDAIAKEADEVFKPLVADAEKWAENVANETIAFSGNAAEVLKEHYDKDAKEAAAIMKNTLDKSEQTIIAEMKNAEYTAEEVGHAISAAFNKSEEEVSKLLHEAGYAVEEVGRFFTNAANTTSNAVSDAANTVGSAVSNTANEAVDKVKKGAGAVAGWVSSWF